MKWTKEQTQYLLNNYPTEMPLNQIANNINKTIKAIKHKAARLEISRIRIPINKPKNKRHRNIYDKEYYKKNKKKIFLKKKERIRRYKKEFIQLLGGKCSKCGYNKSFYALDFHHVGKDKEDNLAKIIKDRSKQKALKEIKKCILLCANCHRELHHEG